ncbi:MAG: hypothetical protein ACOH2B_07950 [Burkholderiaceae bacterium]
MNDEIASRTLLQRIYLHDMDDLNTLDSLGLTLPSPAYLLGAIIFGIIGFAAYRYGKKTYNRNSKWIGIGLMLYPYAVSQTWLLYLVGAGLCAGLYFFRE